jgi:hypothetical protein
MNYYTSIPNYIFDEFQPNLKPSELSVLLVIIRQTLGYIDRSTGKRKRRDWIAIRLFEKKTGLSNRTISLAIERLISIGLVRASNTKNEVLEHAGQRQLESKIFYELTSVNPHAKKMNVSQKAIRNIKWQSDQQRIDEIMSRKKLHSKVEENDKKP